MLNRIVSFLLGGFVLVLLASIGCTKLDTTKIGNDLLPVVDNINTFADTIPVITSQGAFDNDSTRLTLFEDYVVGKISNDPLLGSTDAELYLQFKPTFYPYFFGIPGDTIVGVDSVILCLNYKGIYGDSLTPMTFTVNEIWNQQHGEWDSSSVVRDSIVKGSYLLPISYAPQTGNSVMDAPKTIDIRDLKNQVKYNKGKDSVTNQIRLKLSSAFTQALGQCDTLPLVNGNSFFSKDSMFRVFNKGFAVKVQSGNALLYTNLTDTKTRLEIHYRFKHGYGLDTGYSVMPFNYGTNYPNVTRCAVANHIVRNRPTLPSGTEEILLQTTPGTFANITLPKLTNYPKRMIHRAELFVEVIPTNPIYDSMFRAPNYLYLDIIDSTTSTAKWKPVYYDLNPSYPYDPDFKTGLPFFPSGGVVDFAYFGGYYRTKQDGAIMRGYYNFNLTRYVQMISTAKLNNYKLRLFAPQSFSYPQYQTADYDKILNVIPYNNSIAYGRVKIGGGENPTQKYKMWMRVIYSDIK